MDLTLAVLKLTKLPTLINSMATFPAIRYYAIAQH